MWGAFAVIGLLGLAAVVWEGLRTGADQEKVSHGIADIKVGIQEIKKTVGTSPKAQALSPVVAPVMKSPEPPPKPRLKPLVAYPFRDLLLKPAPQGVFLQGFNLVIMNESDETLVGKMTHERILADGQIVVGRGCEADLGVIELKSGATSSCTPKEGDFLLAPGTKTITVEFGIEYDTVPRTGVRHSYRELTYDLNWADGPNKLPTLAFQYTKSREY